MRAFSRSSNSHETEASHIFLDRLLGVPAAGRELLAGDGKNPQGVPAHVLAHLEQTRAHAGVQRL
ncbi:MAG: hypothetical protein ACREVT_01115 [Burkholderiales bacterium]